MTECEAAGPTLRLALPKDPSAIEQARQGVLDFLAPHAPGPAAVFAIELVIEEALMNIVRYAFPGGGPYAIGLAVSVEAGRVMLRFEDDGIAFDPLSFQSPPTPTSIDTAVPGGLGIRLMRRAANTACYRRLGSCNVLTIGIALR